MYELGNGTGSPCSMEGNRYPGSVGQPELEGYQLTPFFSGLLGDLLEAGVVLWVKSRFLWVPLPCRQVMSPAEVAPKLSEAWRLCTRGMV